MPEISEPVRRILSQFRPDSGTIYLDSATYGLPPQATVDKVRHALEGWQRGSAHWIQDWDQSGERCRELFAGLIGAAKESVSLQPAVSVASGIVAGAVPRGGKVLLAEGDFTSVGYPFLEAQRVGRLTVREAAVSDLASSIGESTDLVAFSWVQSATGELADIEAISRAAKKVGARLYVDVSQCLGVLPVNVERFGIDFLACAGYKWLCCPRGVAFLYVRPERWSEPIAFAASWRAGDDPYGRYYGSPLALADTAARFDVSLAWHAWVGAEASLEVLTGLDDKRRFALANGAARAFTEGLALPAPGAAAPAAGSRAAGSPAAGIVSLAVSDSDAVNRVLSEARVKASSRSGRLRLAFHIYNTEDQARRVADLLRPYVLPRR